MKPLIVYLIAINIITFFLFGADKHKAKKYKQRISEKTLLSSATIGGSIGALLSMFLFNHKIRKKKFIIGIPIILITQVFIALKYFNAF